MTDTTANTPSTMSKRLVSVLGGRALGARLERMMGSTRHVEGKFKNTHPTRLMGSPDASMLRDFAFGAKGRSPRGVMPLVQDIPARLALPSQRGLRVTWLGHSTLLLEIDGVTLLTDPVWGERASPSSFAGPRRFHPPPLKLSELPHIDAVVLSHDHYDHLCHPTMKKLVAGEADFSGKFFVPLGVGAHLEAWGVAHDKIVEHDWGDESRLPARNASAGSELRLVATPAQHFSGRAAFDRNNTLWCSWTFIGPRHRVFFSGDTGLTREFFDIGEAHGPFDLAMFEIGAFHPAWGDIHLGPDNALEAFRRVKADALLPIHWSTFDLGLHPWQEPMERLWSVGLEAKARVLAPQLGEPFEPGAADLRHGPWWRDVDR